MLNIMETLLTRKGQIATVTTRRPLKMRKGAVAVEKVSTYQVRLGVNYDKIKSVIEKREDGELPSENAGLPWGEWVTFPVLLKHNNILYVRCTTIESKMRVAPKYYRDGAEVAEEVVKPEALASEFADKGKLDIFNIRLDSIEELR